MKANQNRSRLQGVGFSHVFTARQALALPASPLLDEYLRREIIGSDSSSAIPPPPYSSSPTAAFLIVEALAKRGWAIGLSLELSSDGRHTYLADFVSTDWFVDEMAFNVRAFTPALAICRAAIHANSVREVPSRTFHDFDQVHWTADKKPDRIWEIDSPQFTLLGRLCFLIRSGERFSRIVPTAELQLVEGCAA